MGEMISTWSHTVTLSWRLFSRTIGAKYRKSYLGYFWMVAPAILISAGVSLASKSGVINAGETLLPYPLFVFLGTVIWQIFADALDVPHQAFEEARSYLTRVYFARETIILMQLYESLISMLVRLALTLLLVAVFGHISWLGVGLVTLCFGGAVLLGLGIGAMLMPFTLLFSDLHNTIKLALSYGLFLTPALYAPGKAGVFSTIVRLNPISPLMNSAREAAMSIAITEPGKLIAVMLASIALTIVGMVLIRLSAPIVIERMLLGGR